MFNTLMQTAVRSRIVKLGSGHRKLVGLLLKFGFSLTFLIGGRRSSSLYTSVVHFGGFLLSWKGGTASLVKYLKVSQIMLMQAVSGTPGTDCRSLGSVVRRGLGGIPALIPHVDRIRIMRGDTTVLRLWLSLLGVYRVMKFEGKASFKTITKPGIDIKEAMASLSEFLPKLALDSLGTKVFKRIPVPKLKFRPMAILTSGPNVLPNAGALWACAWDAQAIWNHRKSPWYHMFEDYCLRTMNTKVLGLIRQYVGLAHDVRTLDKQLLSHVISSARKGSVWSRSLAFVYSPTRVVDDEGARTTHGVGSLENFGSNLVLGRLHTIPEAAGKVRVVAMVTWWVQCLLYPLHEWLFSRTLAVIPQDGTHNQTKPLEPLCEEIAKRLASTGKAHVYSYDLKAATDRIPIDMQVLILTRLIGGPLARAWKTILVGIPYVNRPIKATPRTGWGLRYAVGQPMGAYSSWAMLALTHHVLVQFAAYKAGWRSWYPYYAVLGDDIVVLGKGVAKRYVEICTAFGIEISLSKSLISNNGTFEFAKRFYYRGKDASPLSAKEYQVALTSTAGFVELIARAKAVLPNLRIADVIRSYSKGYRVIGRLTAPLANLGNTRVANFLTALMLPGGPYAKELSTLFSPTSTVVKPDSNLVDTPITERRVRALSRSIGQSIEQLAGVLQRSKKTFLTGISSGMMEYLRGRSDRSLSAGLDLGIAPYLSFRRSLAIDARERELTALGSLGTYLKSGKLNSKGVVTLIEKLIPIWVHTIGDVGALPQPEALNPAIGEIRKVRLHKLLKLRIKFLGLPWKGVPTDRTRVTRSAPQ
nr:MAG: putative RNA-dependent RNA polymerase [Mitoviridae sp.]